MPKYVGQMMKNLIKIVLEGGKTQGQVCVGIWKNQKAH